MGNQPLYSVGLVKKAVEDGCKNINGVIIEGAEAFIPLMENAAKAEGTKIGKFVTLPATAQDYSPQVAEATSGGADCLVMIVSETPYIAWMPAFAQSGSEAKMYGPQGNFNENAVKGFEEVVEGDVNAGMYPDISTDAWGEYREALDKFEADPAQDYNSLGGMGTWAAYEGFKQVVESMSGENRQRNVPESGGNRENRPAGHGPAAQHGGKLGQNRRARRVRTSRQSLCRVQRIQRRQAGPDQQEFTDVSEIAGGTQAHGLRAAVRLIAISSPAPGLAPGAAGALLRTEREHSWKKSSVSRSWGSASAPPTRSPRRA